MMSSGAKFALMSLALGATALGHAATAAPEAAKVGAPAPAFSATDSNGKTVSLADFKGKTVVLEWTNHGCPFVQKHYTADNMQKLQKKWTAQGVTWLTLISSARGAQGHVSGAEANKLTETRGAAPTAVLFDETGTVGRAYGAQVTPHMYVIKSDGTLAYMGGIDDKPTADTADIPDAKNFVDTALTEIAAGKAVTTTTAKPYGCSVKYSS